MRYYYTFWGTAIGFREDAREGSRSASGQNSNKGPGGCGREASGRKVSEKVVGRFRMVLDKNES